MITRASAVLQYYGKSRSFDNTHSAWSRSWSLSTARDGANWSRTDSIWFGSYSTQFVRVGKPRWRIGSKSWSGSHFGSGWNTVMSLIHRGIR